VPEPDEDTQGDHPDSDRHSDQHAQEARQHEGAVPGIPDDFDVTDVVSGGEPIHHASEGGPGDGAD
jgi:hypothetical protein